MSSGPPAGLREAVDDDSWALVSLIGACWAEYPGCVMDAHGECPELLAPRSHYRSMGGALWVIPEGAWVAACVGWRPGPAAIAELVKLYVARHRRRAGLGRALAGFAEEQARAAGATAVELWSDTRFTAGHRLYEALGYRASGATRQLHDLSLTTEFHYQK